MESEEGREKELGSLAFYGVALGGFSALFFGVARLRAPTAPTELAGVGLWMLGSAPLFLGILAGLKRPFSPGTTSLKLVGLCLGVAAPLMGEGLICLIVILPWNLIIAPLVAALTAFCVKRYSSRRAKWLLVIPFLLPLLERPVPYAELPQVTFEDSVEVALAPEQVWDSIDHLRLGFDTPAPWLIRLGLPQPMEIVGGGADVGSIRRVVFKNGTVVARVTESERPRRFAFDLEVENPGREFFDHWSRLEDSSFELTPLPTGGTRIAHRTRYRSLLTPRWYFEPIERWGGKLVQGYLLEAYAEQLRQHPQPPLSVSAR